MTKEEWYVILNMNCKYEICRKCPKSGLFKGSYKECEKWIEKKRKEEEMKEVILNDECAHCKDKECHDGEHFCNQAFKENSFYKNAKLYKGLEVIQRPTYAELEQEIERLKGDLELWENGACRKTNLDKCGVVKELKAQIEKMKCCGNCVWSDSESELVNPPCKYCDFNNKWELRR